MSDIDGWPTGRSPVAGPAADRYVSPFLAGRRRCLEQARDRWTTLRLSTGAATLDAMVIFLPLVLVLLVSGLLSGETTIVLVLPMLVVLGAGVVVVVIAMRDGRKTRDPSVRQLPTDHLRRQMYMALRPHRSKRQPGRDEPS